MTNVTIGKAELKPAQTTTQEQSDKERLKDFLKNLGPDEPNAEDMLWDCLESHGYKATRLAFEKITQDLIKESKALIEMLEQQMEKPTNRKLKEKWSKFNTRMGEGSTISWKSISDFKLKSKSQDIVDLIRNRKK